MFFQVSKLGHYSEEIRRSLSEILLSVMNILLQKYKNIQSNNKRNVADQESFFIDGRLAVNDFPIIFGRLIFGQVSRLSPKISPTEKQNTVCTCSKALVILSPPFNILIYTLANYQFG